MFPPHARHISLDHDLERLCDGSDLVRGNAGLAARAPGAAAAMLARSRNRI
ncbi:hypothetical protein FRUB_02388 [Fimbriiglobus ruber]|uniref:Uncharacterized protein n=1 Tax=Fimbriiglobus ruber TaxID=1908690 RepID=A0A225E302_9BACT|nr:hypothetical protein FRUB_02388 [Fimbriiglobus ruber]